jgi:hypothetical protein
MARIPKHEIERWKREVSLERLVEAQGIKLKRHGADLLGLCPFHDDREPPLLVSPKKNLWRCLGACHAGGAGATMPSLKKRTRSAGTKLTEAEYELAAGELIDADAEKLHKAVWLRLVIPCRLVSPDRSPETGRWRPGSGDAGRCGSAPSCRPASCPHRPARPRPAAADSSPAAALSRETSLPLARRRFFSRCISRLSYFIT